MISFSWIILPEYAHSQNQKTWQWVKQLGSNLWDISAGVACDSKNNLYVAGSFYDMLRCDTKKVKSYGNQDIFIAKFSEVGVLAELVSAGGKGNDRTTCLIMTADDKLAIGGVVSDSATFLKIKVNGVGQRLFVATLDASANFTWISTLTFTGEASLYLICADKQGTIFVSGVFTGTLEAENQKVISKGKKDIFLARLNKTGNVEKLISFGSEEDDSPSSITVDGSGNVVLAGIFGKPFEIGEIKLSTESSGMKSNAFISMFDKDFKAQWSNILQSNDYMHVSSLGQDNSGNLYASGSFSSRLLVGDTTMTSSGYTDVFLIKYKSDGKLDWGRSFGSWYYDYATHLNIDNLGGAILTGSIGDSLSVDSLDIKPLSKGNSALIIQFSSSGKALWADCISGAGSNFSEGSVLDKKGNLYVTGSFRDKFEKSSDVLTSFGDQDVFLAKYYNCASANGEIFGQISFCPGLGTELSVKRSFTNVSWNDTIQGKYSIMANKPGQYWVSMLDKKGCLLTDTILVSQRTLPFFTLGNDTILPLTDSLILHAPAKFSEYVWNDYSSEAEYIAKSPQKKPGIFRYWLTVTDSLSCHYSDTISITYLKGPELIDLEKVQIITYPNPADDLLSWYLTGDETCKLLIELSDENGRILYNQSIEQYKPGEVQEISLHNMLSGFYNLKITNTVTGKNFKAVRVIKQ